MPTTVLLPIKRVPDPYARVRLMPDGSGFDPGGLKFEINPFDEIAVEAAVRLREGGADLRLVAASVGGPESDEQLRKALAMGADEAIRVDADPTGPAQVAAELAALALETGAEWVLMGKQGTDFDLGQTGPRLAAALGWPLVGLASQLDLSGPNLKITRETDEGWEQVEVALPAVVTVDLRLNEPRFIALPAIVRARSKPLTVRPAATAPGADLRRLGLGEPAAKPPGRRVESASALVAALKEAGLV